MADEESGTHAEMLPETLVEIVVVRDPDRSNDYTVFINGERCADPSAGRLRVVTHDVDAGASDITPEWVAGELTRAQVLSPHAAAYARAVVAEYATDNDVEVGPEK